MMEDTMEIYWYDRLNGILVPYNKDEHAPLAKKFIMWRRPNKGILIIGASGFHKLMHEEAYMCEPSIVPHTSKSPSAAGDCKDGIITGWVSNGFHVRTPTQYFGPIADALGMQVSPEPKMEFTE